MRTQPVNGILRAGTDGPRRTQHDGGMSARPPRRIHPIAPAPPDRVAVSARFVAIDPIGAGRRREVWRGVDRTTGEPVAIKLVARRGREQSCRELLALQRLQVPGVVRLIDHGSTPGGWFFVTEWIDGRPFPGRTFDGTWRSLEPVLTALLETLSRVHGFGLLHRDLKPKNVLVRRDGTPVLLDFGCAAGPTECDPAGTPNYLAPEQLFGAPPDERADLYAVGVMLYEVLDGHPPHQAPEWISLAERKRTTPPAPLVGPPDLPDAVRRLVAALVARRHEDRPRTAREVLAALHDPR